jgi:DNA-binding transcriptional LysR family regulator
MIKNVIMKFSYDDLAVLVAAGESGSFREAAALLKVSQASVTNRLQELGRSFAVPILLAEGKKKVLSPFGRRVADAAKEAFGQLKLAIEEAERLHGDTTGIPVRIGCRAEVFAYALQFFPPETAYELVALGSADIGPALLHGRIDVGLTPTIPDSLHLLARPAFRSGADLVVHQALLKQGQRLHWKDASFLKNTPALVYNEQGHLLAELCDRLNLPFSSLAIKAVAESWSTLAGLVGAGRGYAVLPSYVETGPQVRRVPLPGGLGLEQEFSLLLRKAYKDVPIFRQILRSKWPKQGGIATRT